MDINTEGVTWRSLEAYLEKELEECHTKLAQSTCPDKLADQMRGHIARINKILALPKDPITQPDQVETDLTY